MEKIEIEASENSPYILLDPQAGRIVFKGSCYPENTFEFFQPVISWLEVYVSSKRVELSVVEMQLTYFNSATTQVLFDILELLDQNRDKGVLVKWYYDTNDPNGKEDFLDFSEEFPDLEIVAVAYEKKV